MCLLFAEMQAPSIASYPVPKWEPLFFSMESLTNKHMTESYKPYINVNPSIMNEDEVCNWQRKLLLHKFIVYVDRRTKVLKEDLTFFTTFKLFNSCVYFGLLRIYKNGNQACFRGKVSSVFCINWALAVSAVWGSERNSAWRRRGRRFSAGNEGFNELIIIWMSCRRHGAEDFWSCHRQKVEDNVSGSYNVGFFEFDSKIV